MAEISFFVKGNLTWIAEEMTSKVKSMIMGITAWEMGTLRFVMGRAAISEISRVVIRSEMSSCPICRFPISLMDVRRMTYMIIVLTKMVVKTFTSSGFTLLLFVQKDKMMHFLNKFQKKC